MSKISDIIFIQTSDNNQIDYSYDNRGNLYLKTTKTYTATGTESTDVTSMGESTLYEYDGFNRLTDVTNGGNKADYEYNTAGIRTSKTVNGERIDFVLDGINVIAEIKDGDVTNYVRGLTGIIYRKTKDGTKTYYVKNNHGDVTKLVNSSGVVIKSYNYNEFGIESNVDKTDTNPFRYCGEYYDNETGLIYLRARYYDMTIGRFISEDPARDELNWYAYCEGDPINYWDPTGLTIYYFYNLNWETQAKYDRQFLQNKFGKDEEIKYIPITKASEVYTAWNKMDDSNGAITAVIFNMHGDQYKMCPLWPNKDPINNSKLSGKNINVMLLLSCGTGSEADGYKNVATDMLDNNNILRGVIAPTRDCGGHLEECGQDKASVYTGWGPGFFTYYNSKDTNGNYNRIKISEKQDYVYSSINDIFNQAGIYNYDDDWRPGK